MFHYTKNVVPAPDKTRLGKNRPLTAVEHPTETLEAFCLVPTHTVITKKRRRCNPLSIHGEIVVVFTITHRRHLVCGHKTGSNNPGVVEERLHTVVTLRRRLIRN